MTSDNPFGVRVIRRPTVQPEGSKAGVLVVNDPIPAPELQLHDRAFIDAGGAYPGSNVVMFTQEGEDGVERFDDESQPLRWRKIMQWPRPPTVQEAEAWQLNANAEAHNELINRLEVFQETWRQCEELAAMGDLAKFWAPRMMLSPGQKGVSIYDVAFFLHQAAPVARAAWRRELGDQSTAGEEDA
jgi:hypothetical protein